jgi:DNA (cytosine-5)-methyltransferase 1
MIRFVELLRPKLVFMENVAGLAKGKNLKILNSLITALRDDLGYYLLKPAILDAADYGVPQHRERLFLIGSRKRLPLGLPKQSHFSPKEANDTGKLRWVTVGDAFSGITRLSSGQQSSKDRLHKSRKHTALSIERLKHIPKNGGSRKSLPENLQLKCHKNGTGFNDVYGRLHSNRPSNTLTTGCTNFTKGRFAHPTANRAITPREAARLQTFPDSYIFKVTYDQISTQIGNAVPVKFAEAFASYFLTLPLEGM